MLLPEVQPLILLYTIFDKTESTSLVYFFIKDSTPFIDRSLSICQNHSHQLTSYWEFHFKSKLSSQMSKILNGMHEGNAFPAKSLG